LGALGGGTTFRGNILASTITVAAGALVDGRLLAKDAAVTLSSNNVTRMSCT
ncbi:MAG: Ice-binding-like, partial [Solirubrobacterales bacterium]|nr:Ice-binding-like [Solirubrobacterales bacterium]